MPTPLPPNPFPPGAFHAAYQRCLALEAAAPSLRAPPHCPPPIICARILGHLLCLASANGQGQLKLEITSAADSVELMELAGFYMRDFICTFRRRCGPTPPPSPPEPWDSSPPSSPSSEDVGMAITQDGGVDYYDSSATARRRDNNRCMLTGKADWKDGPRSGSLGVLQAAHIIPQVSDEDDDHQVGVYDYFLVPTQEIHSAGVLAILSMFTNVNIVEELAGKQIHRLENVMTLESHCHHYFADLGLWLKPVMGLPHTYQVHEAYPGLKTTFGIPDIVTFNAATESPLPPEPAFLALHALCCEVAWTSGVAEYMDDVEQMMDELCDQEDYASPVDVLMKAVALVETRLY